MKKTNLIKCASLLCALAPAAVLLASCGGPASEIPSNYNTVGLGDLWVSKKEAGKDFNFKVTLQDPLEDYVVCAAIVTGDKEENYEVESIVETSKIKAIDQYNNHIGLSTLGTFGLLNTGDVYFTVNLGENLAKDHSLAFATMPHYANEDGSERFEDIDIALTNKYVSFGCYLNQGTPCIFEGVEVIDEKICPIFYYAGVENGQVSVKAGYLDRCTRGEGADQSAYYIGRDWETDEELNINTPTLVIGIAKLANIGALNNSIEISSIITLDQSLDTSFCYVDIQPGETCYFHQKVEKSKEYRLEMWGTDPLIKYTSTYAPLAVVDYINGKHLERSDLNHFKTNDNTTDVLFSISNVNPLRLGDLHITHVYSHLASEDIVKEDGTSTIVSSTGVEIKGENYAGKHVSIVHEAAKTNPLITVEHSTGTPAPGQADLNSYFKLTLEQTANIDVISSARIMIEYQNLKEEKPEGGDRRTYKLTDDVNISNFYLDDYSKNVDKTTVAIDRETLLDAFGLLDKNITQYDIHIRSISVYSVDGILRTKADCEALSTEELEIKPVSATQAATVKLGLKTTL